VKGGSLHESVAALLDRTGALDAAIQLRRAAPFSMVSIVTFHRIAEVDDGEPYDPDVVDATPAQLRHHVETLARIGTPIGMETLLRALDGGRLPPNPVMITFDDGYRSCRDVALPILRRLGVPATFFIATAFASERKLYWWEQIAAILHIARGRVGDLTYPHRVRIFAGDPGARRRLDDTVKNTHGLDLDRFLGELRAALEVPWSPEIEARLATPLIMTWDDIRALAAAGMDVESHTRTHRVLETLDRDQLRDDLVGSRNDLETQLGRPVRAIAYPVGRSPPLSVRHAVAQAGYQIGLTNASGVNYVWPAAMVPLDRFDIHRLSTERSQSDAMFLSRIAVPQLGSVCRGLALRRSRRPRHAR
jgi:peptidoglycan/xylan/chitin deacetylase (PgdA/CDA1 family)